METDDVQEIQENGNGIGSDVNDVDEALKSFIVYDPRWETIIEDVQQVDAEDNGQVEPHPIEIKRQGLSQIQLMEKLDVEQIEHPAADAEGHQSGYQSVNQQHIRR